MKILVIAKIFYLSTCQICIKKKIMKAQDSSILLNNVEERVEKAIQIAIKEFQNLPESILLKPSITGGWSIVQCLEHLNTYGYFYLPEIKKGFENNIDLIANPQFKSSWLGNYFTGLMKPNAKNKMKAFKKHVPDAELDSIKVIQEFINQQELLLKYLRLAKNTDINKIKIPISLTKFIKLKLGDVFQFITAHIERHLVQAQRNL